MSDATKSNKTPNRRGEYAKLAVLLPDAVEKLTALINSRNEAISLGAVKVVMDKCLPDIKAVEVSGSEGKDLEVKINIIHEREIKERQA